jgi:2-polyprenyl-3-methyl-5-hydroxy-6-metoxy-1,4-benzoquinol methylase
MQGCLSWREIRCSPRGPSPSEVTGLVLSRFPHDNPSPSGAEGRGDRLGAVSQRIPQHNVRTVSERAAITPTDEAYELLAPHFRAYARRRAAYLDAVDRIVALRIPDRARSLLDVGAGDGVRAAALAHARGLTTVVLAEPSPSLVARCRERPAAEVWCVRAEELPLARRRFDVVTCLWNVLGHVPTRQARLEALARMRALLAPGGVMFVDVQNRYNARAYGRPRTLARWLFDCALPSESHGDVVVAWPLGDRSVRLQGHVFSPRQIEALFAEAGLAVARRYVVDYESGQLRRFVFQGQLLYELRGSAGASDRPGEQPAQ